MGFVQNMRGILFWEIRSLGICQCLQKKACARHERGSRCSRLERERGFLGSSRCWWEENRGWPAQGELCGAAHRPCASALLTHSGAGEDLPAGHWKITGKHFLVTPGISAQSCVFASVSPGCNSWEGRRPKASDRVANHI